MSAGRPRKYLPGIDRPDERKLCRDCGELFPRTQEFFYVLKSRYFFEACIPCVRGRNVAAKHRRNNPKWKDVLAAYSNRCAYCGAGYDAQDHILPKVRGGSDSLANLVPACTSCNGRKADLPLEFLVGLDKAEAIVLRHARILADLLRGWEFQKVLSRSK